MYFRIVLGGFYGPRIWILNAGRQTGTKEMSNNNKKNVNKTR